MSDSLASFDPTNNSAIREELTRYRPRRSQRYSSVNILLMLWKDDDIGVAPEVAKLANFFRDCGFLVWPYHIPSIDSQSKLHLKVAQFVDLYSNDADALMIVYYSGHGGKTLDNMSSECTWAAKRVGGPTVDWSNIQPTFVGARCDVLILLDCCFAGQAARPHLSNTVELLTATDKDQFTPTGKIAGRPSFTAVLMEQLALALQKSGSILVSELHHRMQAKECQLVKQPFYTKFAESQTGAGIRLARWVPMDGCYAAPNQSPDQAASFYLRVSLFQPLSPEKRTPLLRWMTKDSPANIEHIELVQQSLSDAKAIGRLGNQVLEQGDAQMQSTEATISSRTREEANRLIEALDASLKLPESCQFEPLDVSHVVESIGKRSRDLLAFLKDNLATIGKERLDDIRGQELPNFQDLRSRIEMRLFLIHDEVPMGPTKVYFDLPVPLEQRRAVGKAAEETVLVEYWCYDASDHSITKLATQAARVSALISEKKDEAFRILPGLGYIQETVRQRFGFIYQLPEGIGSQDIYTLAEIIPKVKYVPLEVRKRLASAICQAVLHLHSIGWYHKEIKSANIIIFRRLVPSESDATVDTYYDMENPYVVGFDCSRPSEAETWASEDHSGVKGNLYRHPDRWGKPDRFERQHDIYALGILLLELGSWKLLPGMDGSGKGFENVKKPLKLRDTMLAIADAPRLAHSNGSEYSEAIKFCLSDQNWGEFEPWEAQKIVREKVLQAVSEGENDHCKHST
ncbi:hypothetical protein CC86DRAFT_464137 [Ophiobolus disseminans]|uniref:Protein kinase domain-containing protein n=1 Tax=Ophiobolus disseminans TaxID=1469910 RepID=A0A6A7A8J2_9PLEO|nr:hypothetical protein CC86DRAFT_464137 [Ophiobolus disseminans]